MKTLGLKKIKSFFKDEMWKIDELENCQLNSVEEKQIKEYVIRQLDSRDPKIRYIAAHIIRELKINEATDKLIERILDNDTFEYNGTMTYALEDLNCQNNLVNIYKILATQSIESKMHAYSILKEQEFIFTAKDLLELKNIFEIVSVKRKENQILDKETFEAIKDCYEGFFEYITEID